MKRYIDVRIDKNHCYYCSNKIIARQNENNATAIRIQLLEEMLDKWIYIEFAKPNGEKVCTPRLEIKNGVAIFDIPNTLTDVEGVLGVEIVIRDSEDVVWKSFKKTYLVEGAINASETVEEANTDFITEAQKLLDEIKLEDSEEDPTVPQYVKNITKENIANWNKVDDVENVLKDILTAIQEGGTTSNTITEIEQIIVSYFENLTVGEVEE